MNTCPGCSAPLTFVGGWAVCPKCDGMIGHRVPEASMVARLGPLGEWDEGNDMSNPATCRYFDVVYHDWRSGLYRRAHGWYNPVNGKMVQSG